jgi:hypothetical protein
MRFLVYSKRDNAVKWVDTIGGSIVKFADSASSVIASIIELKHLSQSKGTVTLNAKQVAEIKSLNAQIQV